MAKKQTVNPARQSYRISIFNRQKSVPVCDDVLLDVVGKILKSQKVFSAQLSIVIVTDRTIKTINRRFLSKDRATDVIAFDLKEKRTSGRGKVLEGEVYVSAVTARRVAKGYHMTPWQELVLYVAHGILHLLGYDDHALADRKKMRQKEKEVLNYLGDLLVG